MKRHLRTVTLCLLLACSHSDTYVLSAPTVGPSGTTADVQLTFNADQDYWPAWTEDGAGILYAFVPTTATPYHRCIGLLPASGGTTLWQLCDNRAVNNDTATSYTAFALGSGGRLLYAEAASPIVKNLTPTRGTIFPSRVTLWLADSATPFKRTALDSNVGLSWYSELNWTGPNSFLMLQQNLTMTNPPQPPCDFAQDTTWSASGIVVAGTITGTQATLQPVRGTDGATGYSLAENGASIVFTTANDTRLFKVPTGGGAATTVATGAVPSGSQLLGVSCKRSTCLTAVGPTLSLGAPCHGAASGPRELRSVSLAGGPSQSVYTTTVTGPVIVTPQVSPVSGDVVIGLGGNLGHVMTVLLPTDANLHLLKGVLP